MDGWQARTAFGEIKISSSELQFVHFPIEDCSVGDDDAVLELAEQLVEHNPGLRLWRDMVAARDLARGDGREPK